MKFFVQSLCATVEHAAPDRNRLRGAFGSALRETGCAPDCTMPANCPQQSPCMYRRFFDPEWKGGPSGYRNAPRPFVLRNSGIELCMFAPDAPLDELERAFAKAVHDVCGSAQFSIERRPELHLPLTGASAAGSLRLEFVTPTVLKSDSAEMNAPEFLPLFKRLAERIRAIGRLYQKWPAGFAFPGELEDAAQVRLSRFDWVRSEEFRRSARSGVSHSVGGFSGWAEYQGPIGSLLPLLEIGCHTGVGRQTVWGNGEIRIAHFHPSLV